MATFSFVVVSDFLWIKLPTEKKPVVIYSNHLHHPLRHVIIKALQLAKSSIYLHTYSLTDEAVIDTLLTKAPLLENLQIVTDSKTLPSYFSHLDLPWKPIKSSGLMHTKILGIDDTTVFLGTANMTYESLTMHDNIVLGLYHPELASYLHKYSEEVVSKKRYKTTSHQCFSLKEQHLELWLLPYQGEDPLHNLQQLIQKASSSICIAMFTLTHPILLEELIAAHHRGVAIQVFLDHTSASGASAKALAYLKEKNIPVYLSTGIQLLHHKLMLLDGKTFVLGSTNWTKAAFKKNYDFYLTLSPLLISQQQALKQLFTQIAKASLVY